MKVQQSFVVDRPVDVVWRALADAALVADCLPGAELTAAEDGHLYHGKMKVKLGPMTAAFAGKAKVARDDAERSGSVEGTGLDSQSGSRAKAKMTYRVTPADGGASDVAIDAEIVLSGALAQFGRSEIVNDIAARLTETFAQNLQGKLSTEDTKAAPAPPAPELNVFRLLLAALWRRIQRVFGGLWR
jgi:carbon-monoxide dehydrogenase small subunit